METRLRWLLISNRLPRPEVQVDLHDASGRFVSRADLLYPEAKLVIEYDGGNHRDRLVSDDQRQNLIISAGFRILRFTGPDVCNRAEVVAAQVRRGVGYSSVTVAVKVSFALEVAVPTGLVPLRVTVPPSPGMTMSPTAARGMIA